MKKIGVIIAIVVGIILIWGIGAYNGFVKKQEAMTTAWSQVENVYQRRADLVPNLVAVVKNYAEYEQGTLIAVTEARARLPIPLSTRRTSTRPSLPTLRLPKRNWATH